MTCNPSGNPETYTYHRWQHKSKYGETIRELDGNKTLKLPDVPVRLIYQDGGEYVCTVSNGIRDNDDKLEQTGSGYITVYGNALLLLSYILFSYYDAFCVFIIYDVK